MMGRVYDTSVSALFRKFCAASFTVLMLTILGKKEFPAHGKMNRELFFGKMRGTMPSELLSKRTQRLELVVGQSQRRRRDIFLLNGPPTTCRGSAASPGSVSEATPARAGRRSRRGAFAAWSSTPPGLDQLAAGHGEPGNKADRLFGAVVQKCFGLALGQVVQVLDRNNVYYRLRVLKFFHRHFGQADVPNFALRLQVFQRSERLVGRHFRVNSVKLIQIIGEAGTNQSCRSSSAAGSSRRTGAGTRAVRPASHWSGPCRVSPPLVAITRPSAYGCRGIGDQVFRDKRPVRVGGVNEVDAQFERPAAKRAWLRPGLSGRPRCLCR